MKIVVYALATFMLLMMTLVLSTRAAAAANDKIWTFCTGDKQDPNWLMQIDSVELNPPLPKSGAPFTVHIVGTLKEKIDDDALVEIDVSYGGVQLFEGKQGLCVPGFLTCPIAEGKIDQTFTQTVPGFAPPGGPYTGTARFSDGQNNTFSCIKFDFMMDSMSGAAGKQSASVEEPAITDEIIKAVNSKKGGASWVAGHNSIFAGKTLSHVQQKFVGARLTPQIIDKHRQEIFGAMVKDYPETFDWRSEKLGSQCIHPIRNQLHCGSCWAFAGSEALSDRFCIASNGTVNVVLSPQYMVSCDKSNFGCNGGYLNKAWAFMKSHGLPTEQCMPYTAGEGKVQPCSKTCADGSQPKFYHVDKVSIIRGGAREMQAEIMKRGPVEAGFTVYKDFLAYKGGVYTHVTGEMLGGHAIKIIGWGVSEASKMPYWIAANSWGEEWGQNGFFWIRRGKNDCGIESNVVAGTVAL